MLKKWLQFLWKWCTITILNILGKGGTWNAKRAMEEVLFITEKRAGSWKWTTAYTVSFEKYVSSSWFIFSDFSGCNVYRGPADRNMGGIYICSTGNPCFLCQLTFTVTYQCADMRDFTAGLACSVYSHVRMGLWRSASDVWDDCTGVFCCVQFHWI